MQRSTLSLILGLLVLTPAVLSEIGVELNYDDDLRDQFSKKYDIKSKINLKCTITGGDGGDVVWMKEGVEVVPDERKVKSAKDNVHTLRITHAKESDAGLYECVVGDIHRANITLLSKVHVKTPTNLNFVEGEAIKIVCQVLGKPTPSIFWTVDNETYDESRDRVELETDPESNVENTVFIIKDAQMSDRKDYICNATNKHGDSVASKTFVRIKDKYAALWPFLGICAEVFVLCAIILIYEKKRNKTELEESDTDQSPDQKNTPDHGKDTNLRHRQ